MSIFIFSSLTSSIYIPIKLCLFPQDTTNSSECLFVIYMAAVITSSLACITLFYSTYHGIVHCFPFIVIFAAHLPWGFNKKTSFCRVYLYRLYHIKVDLIHPYNDFNTIKYSKFCLPFCLTFFLHSGLNSHIIFKNSSYNVNNTNLFSGMS